MPFMLLRTAFYACAGAVALCSAVSAQSLTGSVSSANITRGEGEVEARYGVNDEGAAGSRLHVQYGFSDWYRARVIFVATDRVGQGWRYGSTAFENHFQWAQEGTDNGGFHGGLRVSYIAGAGNSDDAVGTRLIVTDRFAGRWEWRANFDVGMPVNGRFEDDAELEIRANLTRGLDINLPGTSSWRAGVEVFSELGTPNDFLSDRASAHQAGGMVSFGLTDTISISSRARFGLSRNADDAMFQIAIGRDF